MECGIVGLGAVGKSLHSWLSNNTNHILSIDDPYKGHQNVCLTADVLFVCVPTNTIPSGQDLTNIHLVMDRYKDFNKPIFIKSTVLPGTCDELSKTHGSDVIAMPEFLTERIAVIDFNRQPIICGTLDPYNWNLVSRCFPKKELYFMTNMEAELSKYAHNCFGALKVTYFNTIFEACKRLHCDYNTVLSGVLSSGYIDHNHTQVPGPDGKLGYGGKCFPKDVMAFLSFLVDLGGVRPDLFNKTHELNQCYRDTGSSVGTF